MFSHDYYFRTESGRPVFAFGAPLSFGRRRDFAEAMRAADAISYLVGADDYIVVYRGDTRVYEARGKVEA